MSNRDEIADKHVFLGFPQLVKQFPAAESDCLNFSNTTGAITQAIKRLSSKVTTPVVASTI